MIAGLRFILGPRYILSPGIEPVRAQWREDLDEPVRITWSQYQGFKPSKSQNKNGHPVCPTI